MGRARRCRGYMIVLFIEKSGVGGSMGIILETILDFSYLGKTSSRYIVLDKNNLLYYALNHLKKKLYSSI